MPFLLILSLVVVMAVPAAAMAALWLLMGFSLTWMIIWGSSARDNFRPNQQLKNINPYSAKNEDVLPKNKK